MKRYTLRFDDILADSMVNKKGEWVQYADHFAEVENLKKIISLRDKEIEHLKICLNRSGSR